MFRTEVETRPSVRSMRTSRDRLGSAPRYLWIAATALAHGMSVATLNLAEFSRVDGLHVIAHTV